MEIEKIAFNEISKAKTDSIKASRSLSRVLHKDYEICTDHNINAYSYKKNKNNFYL